MARAQLPRLIQQLLDPAVYPHPVERVELVQTHISYILLAGDYVYKVKKAVDFGFLDYSTLRKRLYYCQREVALNSRFCADTYLGVVRIRERDGRISLEGPSTGPFDAAQGRLRTGRGRVVEYAVKMRRLPAERMLDRLLARGEVTVGMIEQLAERLAEVHAQAETSPAIARYGDWAIRFTWRENFQQWAPFIGETLTAEQDRLLQSYVRSFLRRNRELMRRRVDELRIRDCHGDLRSDSICFVDGDTPAGGQVCIFDCIEFSRRIRYTDVAGDVAFLAMDLEYRGRPGLADAFGRRYIQASGDEELARLLDFWRCERAAVRAKVEGFRLRQPDISAREKRQALRAARRYFALACRYAERDQPLLIITCGLAATGKSVLARALAQELGLALISSDVVRKEMAGLAQAEHRFEPFRRGIYAPRFTDATYRALLQRARALLADGRSAIVDASFIQRKHRAWARRLAEKEGARFLCLECRASEAAVRRRLGRRLRQGGDPSDARWEIYVAQRDSFQPVTELPPGERLVVDSARPLEALVRAVKRASHGTPAVSGR